MALECLVEEYGSIKMAGPLMDRLNLLSTTPSALYPDQDPSENVAALILRIEAADPNCETISENDTNAGWGHYQFTAGSLTLSTVLTAWKDVGNVSTAFRLLAASIKTCRVARHMCFQRGLRPLSYISDIYLDRTVDTLWDLVKDLQPDAEVSPCLVYSFIATTEISCAHLEHLGPGFRRRWHRRWQSGEIITCTFGHNILTFVLHADTNTRA